MKKTHFKINRRIVAVMLVLFAVTCLVVSQINIHNLRSIYEKTFTQRALITNALIAAEINSDEIKHYVDLMRNQNEEFKQRQIQFYYDREELLALQKTGASEESQKAVLSSIEAFSREMYELKTSDYWLMIDKFITLKQASESKYVYLFADTGLVNKDGKKLYTFIFDAEDKEAYDSIDNDGLGTVYDGEDIISEIYKTKKPMETIIYYDDVPYGECYFAYAPILDSSGEVVAILGSDLELGEMNQEIAGSIAFFTAVFLVFVIIMVAFIYIFISRNITNPLIELTAAAQKLSDGDVYTTVSAAALENRSEIGMLARAIADMIDVYQSMIKSTGELLEAANIGKLDVRNDASMYKGSIRKAIEQINDALDATTLYLNSVPESIFIMNKNFETHFKNERYFTVFGGMSAAEFFGNVFAQEQGDSPSTLEERLAEALGQESNGTTAWINDRCFSVVLREIDYKDASENSVIVIAVDITELVNEKENAQAAAKSKSDFLSRMSHEMRTPMNAIIGMTQIADKTDDISRLKYCLSTIAGSSEQLLGVINDVLDMSKIEAGKFELNNAPLNVETILIKVCNLVIDKAEKSDQKLRVVMGKNMRVHYIGDDLRLAQVITNLLSNAVKFTPNAGITTLTVDEIQRDEESSILRFSVSDTGIGMTEEQVSRLFTSFEQADGSITRRFGGTGLGLAISKSIVEKMGGDIHVESEYGCGSTFSFEIRLQADRSQSQTLNDGIHLGDLKLLVAESDADLRGDFLSILDGFGLTADKAASAGEAIDLIQAACEANNAYDVVFYDCDMPDADVFDVINQLNRRVDKDATIIITSFTQWRRIESDMLEIGIKRFIPRPLFPSVILNAINDAIGDTHKNLKAKTDLSETVNDFSNISILLAEDVEINREIVIEILSETRASIDCAENGFEIVAKYKANPDKYNLIFMDIQMPGMDGFQATKAIRSLDIPNAKSIPIIAMTANAFKEDIDRCIECGMNDHLSKPIDEKAVIDRIKRYTSEL